MASKFTRPSLSDRNGPLPVKIFELHKLSASHVYSRKSVPLSTALNVNVVRILRLLRSPLDSHS